MKRLLTLICSLVLLLPISEARASRPNFVVFQVDDMPSSFLDSKYRDARGNIRPLYPNLQRYLQNEGSQFSDFIASSPICAPSRAALLSGQYPHNSRLVTNGGDLGGGLGWLNSNAWRHNLITRLDEEGYSSAHFGKWLNNYGGETDAYLPRGWDAWVSDATDRSTRDFYGYYQRWIIPRLGIDNLEGPIGSYGNGRKINSARCRIYMSNRNFCNYHSDLMTRMAGDEIRASEDPFYIQIDYHAPHGDHVYPVGAEPAARHRHLLKRVILPRRSPNFNESDPSDKAYLTQRNNGRLRSRDIEKIDTFSRYGMVSLKAVDDGIGYIARILENRGILDNTYLFFLSDNGFFLGEHRFLLGKTAAHQESSRVPFLIRGPGVASGVKNEAPVATIDFAPTVLDLAGARPLAGDGLSMLSYFDNIYTKEPRPRLIEMVSPGELLGDNEWQRQIPEMPLDWKRPASGPPNYRYRALKIGDYKYLLYDKGGEELYNLRSDPYELRSVAQEVGYLPLVDYMNSSLQSLRSCSGLECNFLPGDFPTGFSLLP